MTRRPWAVLIGGAPATGKSTLAAALAPRLGAALLDLDVATGPLTTVVSGLIGVADLSDPRIAELTRTARYDTLLGLAADNLRAGLSVVLVAPFTTERTVEGWRAAAGWLAPHAAGLALVWLDLPDHHLVDRLRQRAAARDTAKMQDPEAFLTAIDHAPPAVPHLPLDATRQVPDLVNAVIDYLAHRGIAIDGTA
jgi:predicted kinase